MLIDRKGKTEGKRQKQALCLLLFLSLLAFGAGWAVGGRPKVAHAAATPEAESVSSASVDMNVTYGFQEYVKRGRYVPLYITLHNQDSETFSGTIQVMTMEADREYYLYEHPITVESQKTAKETISVPLSVLSDIFYIRVLDSQGLEAAFKRLKVNCEKDIAELFIGILSDSPQSLEYWNNVGLTTNYNYIKTKALYLKGQEIPKSAMDLDQLDLLLITDYDARKLTRDQLTAIDEWVNHGGVLLLGTGNGAEGILDTFVQEYLEEPYGDAQEKSVNMGAEFATTGPGDADVLLPCMDLALNAGTAIAESDDMALLTSIPKGQGSMVVSAFDYKDIAEFASRQPSYVDKLIHRLFSTDTLENFYQETVFGSLNEYWNVQSMLGNSNMDRIPNVVVFIVVIVLYVILVGPGLYLILKKFDKAEYFRLSVMICAFLGTGLVYFLGQRTRFQDPFYSYATILDQDGENIQDETFMNIRAPFNQPYSVSVQGDYHLTALTQVDYGYYGAEPTFTGEEDYNVAIYYGEENTKISIQDVEAFTPKIFRLERGYESQWGEGLTGNLTLYDGGAKGKVVNHTDYDLSDVAVLMYGNYIYVGDLEKGQEKDLETLTVTPYSVGFYYNVSGKITGSSKFKQPDVNNPEYLTALARSNVLSYYISSHFAGYTEEAKIIGFAADHEKLDFVINEEYCSQGIEMLASSLQVNTLYEGKIYRPVLRDTPTVVNGSYESRLNATFGTDPVTLEYSLGNDLEIEKVDFNLIPILDSEEEEEEGRFYYTTFKGKMYFYNYDTGQFDEKNLDQKSFFDYELGPYLSPANTLMVKYVSEKASEFQWDTCLPVLSVVGREK